MIDEGNGRAPYFPPSPPFPLPTQFPASLPQHYCRKLPLPNELDQETFVSQQPGLCRYWFLERYLPSPLTPVSCATPVTCIKRCCWFIIRVRRPAKRRLIPLNCDGRNARSLSTKYICSVFSVSTDLQEYYKAN